MTKSKSKIIATFLLTIIVMTNILPLSTSLAVHNVGDSIALTSIGEVPLHLKSHALKSGGYVLTHLAGYNENGKFYPAYCLNKTRPGVDDTREYSVTLAEILGDQATYSKIWRVVVAGYPYNSPESLGVSDWRYAYQATKMAIYCVLGQSNVDDFYATDSTGQSIVDLIHRLVNQGEHGQNTYRTPVASINNSGNMVLSGDYYVQNYTISSNVDILNYEVSMTKFPEGTKITNTSGGNQTIFNNGETFQVRIPKNIVETQDINGKLRADVNSKSFAMFYSTSYNSSLQDYAVTGDPVSLTSTIKNISLKANTASIRIKKIDEETKQPIKDTTYELTRADGKVIGRATTDSTGNLTFYELYQNDYILKEVKSNDDYVISQESINIKAVYNKVTEVTLTNKHKEGNLKVYKVDKDNNKITLGNVEFDLYSEEFKKVIGTYKTDVNGEILVKNLRTGDYKWIEKNTNKWYNLAGDINVKVEWEKTNESTIENELKKGQIRVIKVDLDNNEVRLKGVKFNVLDEKNNILETIITNDEGEAVTSRYPIRDFEKLTLQETETLEAYKLNKEKQTIKLEENQIKDIVFTNEKKKGQIRVVKIDLDNNEVKLENVEFKVYDEKGNVVDTLKTDENGEAVSKRLPIDQNYTIQESKTLQNYVLNEEKQTVTLIQDQITDIQFENEKIKGKVEITKISADDNKLTGETKGTKLENAVFEIYNEKDEIVDTITIKQGIGTSKILEYGNYYIVEKNSGSDYYLLNTEKYEIEIRENLKTIPITIENTSVDIGLDIDKNGIVQAQPNDEIKYGFNSLKNTSNVALDNFTWTDNLPYEYVRITKLFTGTYNENLNYVVKYRTNKSEEYIEFGTYNTQKNNYIDFTKLDLAEDEYITDYKVEFGTVMPGFEAVEKPFIFAKVLPTVKAEDKWVNYTSLTGNYKEHELEDKAEWPTISYSKKLEIKKLPRTGF